MKILSLKADGFGALRGEFHFDPLRLTLVVDENERGKSTLLAAIAAGLYGLPKDQRSRKLTPHDRWRPWDGGSYRVEIVVEQDGERYEIRRDFARGEVSVWDGRGRERTMEFREGKDEYPVGAFLLGLDAAEFEKCAFLKHGELDEVVPDDESERRTSTLQARLESAADTRAGDSTALEAQRVLDEAQSRYECPEVSANAVTVGTAIKRFALKEETLEAEVRALDALKDGLREPLEELARLLAQERAARETLAGLEDERRRTRAGELRDRLGHDDQRRADLERLRAEAGELEARPRITADEEAALREMSGQLEEANRQRAELDACAARASATRATLEAERAPLDACESLDPSHADALAAGAQELRRIHADLERAHAALGALPAGIADERDSGHAAALAPRFDALADTDRDLLRGQPRKQLVFQARAIEAAARKSNAMGAAETIRLSRRRRAIPAWILVAIAGLAGGAAWGAWSLGMPWIPVAAGAAALAIAGLALLARAAGTGGDQRAATLRAIEAAENDASAVRAQQVDFQRRLEDLALRLGAADTSALVEDWTRHEAWRERRRPAEPIEFQIAAFERRRDELGAALDLILAAAPGERARVAANDGPGSAPDRLEETATRIRRLGALRERLTAFERDERRIHEESTRAASLVTSLHERARAILAKAGVSDRLEPPLARHLDAARQAAARAARLALLETELLPQAAASRLAPRERQSLEAELAGLAGAATEVGAPNSRALADIDAEIAAIRATLDELVVRHGTRRAQFEEKAQRCQAELAEKHAELQVVKRGRARAERFQAAIELAHTTIGKVAWETHQHWATFLNQRVGEIVRALDADILDVRFGEDLDFSIKLPTGLQVPRGRGVRQLSSGARDQLHLAVRIAISEFLSKGRAPLPLLIDDCFATSDDDRARAGMRLLIEHLSKDRQIVLVTCHRKRHEAFSDLDPALWRERVQWIDARVAHAEHHA